MTVYFFVDGDGTENVSNFQPSRHPTESFWECPFTYRGLDGIIKTMDRVTELPRGTIEALFKMKLTWDDAPIKIDYSNTQPKELSSNLGT